MNRALRPSVTACILIGLVGCADSTTSSEPPRASVVEASVASNASNASNASITSSGAWTWIPSRHRRGPMHLTAPRTAVPRLLRSDLAESATLAFLHEHRERFRMHSPSDELRIVARDTDDLGMTHARFQQTVRGVPVSGAELSAHYDEAGHLTSIDSNYEPDLDGISLTPSVPAPASDATLEISASGSRPRLVWTTTITDLSGANPGVWLTKTDANTGEVVERTNTILFDQATAPGLLGQPQTFDMSKQDGRFALIGAVGNVLIRTFTASNNGVFEDLPGDIVTTNDRTKWDPVAVDAHVYASEVVRYYKEHHHRNSIDGLGGALVSTVHFDKGLSNAFWIPSQGQMVYGDGDGVTMRAFSTSPDIVAHELTHGVSERTSKLGFRDEPGALNEAISDIMGAYFAHSLNPDPEKNWIHGLEKQIDPELKSPARTLADPTALGDPAHLSERRVATDAEKKSGRDDSGWIHTNCNIIGHAAYLMTVGGKNKTSRVEVAYGIGWEKAEKIWYRANAKYWLTNTSFEQAAAGVLSAAKDLELTENEQNIVECAFKAVGVIEGDCATLEDPSPRPASKPSAEEDAEDTSNTSSKRNVGLLPTTQASGCSVGPLGSPRRLPWLGLGLGLVALLRRRSRER